MDGHHDDDQDGLARVDPPEAPYLAGLVVAHHAKGERHERGASGDARQGANDTSAASLDEQTSARPKHHA